jgi:bifunctional polynucleotide phosphatase/kinase
MWYNNNYLHYKSNNFEYRNKIASFDIDGTIIKTKSGKTFPINKDDWEFLYENTIDKLNELYSQNYCIILISNQFILKNNNMIDDWKIKIENINKKIGIPILVYASIKKDIYRKPLPSFWKNILSNINNFDKESFYCGDAAGRINDHSDTDYKFALNGKITFYVPEQLFLNKNILLPPINYVNLPEQSTKKIKLPFTHEKNMIIMVGYPASGKSYISINILEKLGYFRINQDTLKTKKKCLDKVNELLQLEKSVVIDNTNPKKDVRKEYIDLAKKYNYHITCIHMTTSYELSLHNNMYRFWIKQTDIIPTIVFNKFRKDFNEPNKLEGFDEIIKINFNSPIDPEYKLMFI